MLWYMRMGNVVPERFAHANFRKLPAKRLTVLSNRKVTLVVALQLPSFSIALLYSDHSPVSIQALPPMGNTPIFP